MKKVFKINCLAVSLRKNPAFMRICAQDSFQDKLSCDFHCVSLPLFPLLTL